MQVGILGPLTVTIDGRDTPIAGVRLRSLVTRLALDAPKMVTAGELIDDLWADEPPADQANALQSLVSRARRILGPGSLPAVGAGYRLAVDRDDVDAHRFVQLARAGSEVLSTDPAQASMLLTEALELWRGDPLADARGAGYALVPTARLAERRLDCLANRLNASLALGEVAGVVAEAQELASANPLAERLTALHMRALAAAGRPAEALAAFQNAREYLADTLGADPSRELQQLHLELLRGDATPAATDVPQASIGTGTASLRRDNLPAAVTSFLGRDAELERLGTLLQQSRMVTVIGPGGVGKTRLALEIANRSRPEHADGVWLVPLAPVTDPAGLAPAFLDALRLRSGPVMDRRESGPRDVTERLLSSLADAEALLVVDNCEHLITDVAALVGAIAERCPRVKIVATSREPLGLLGESLCPVPPLAVPRGLPNLEQARQTPAVRLLEERARAVRADFRVDDESLSPVLEIVERLDGLPLAIELAAARLRLLPAAEVAALLSDRFRLLTGGNRAALPRHRTLWAVVDWSWNLLTDTERLAAERMSVFAGPWTVSAAVAVCSDLQLDRSQVQDVLLSLADKSLLDTFDGVQYRMLETIREFAIVRSTESGTLDTARQLHAAFYEQTVKAKAARMRGSNQLAALRQLQADHADIQDAIRFLTDAGELTRARTMASELVWFWIVTDRGHDVQSQLLDLAAREPVGDGPSLQLEAFCMLNELAIGMPTEDISRQRAQAVSLAVSLAARMQASGPHRGELGLMELLLNFVAGNYSRAKMLADDLVASSTNRWLRGATLMMSAGFAENFGEMYEMRRDLDAAWVELANHPDRWARAAVAGMRARLHIMDGDIDGAIADLHVALQVAIEMGGMDDELQSRLILSQLYARRGEFSLAHQQFDTMTARWQEYGHSSPAAQERWQTSMLVGRLFVHEVASNDEGALAVRDELLGQLRGLTRWDGHLTAIGWAVVGSSLARTGDFTQARQALATAYPIAMITEDQPVISTVGEAVAGWAARSGHPEQAAEMLGAAARLRGAQDVNDPTIAAARAVAREALGDKEFTVAFERGRAMSRRQAFARIDPRRPTNDPVAPDIGTTGSDDFEAWVYPTGR